MATLDIRLAGRHLSLGDILTPEEFSTHLEVYWTFRADQLYSLVFYDLDAPQGVFTHWLVINIPGENIDSGQTLIDYYAPHPPSGIHRYFIEIYQQPGKLPAISGLTHTNFDREAWVRTYGLSLLASSGFRVRAAS